MMNTQRHLGVGLLACMLLGAGCSESTPRGSAVDTLRTEFPTRAAEVLGAVGEDALVATRAGFAVRPASADPVEAAKASLSRRGGLGAIFPATGEGVVRFNLPGGFAVEVREAGLSGPGRVEARAVVYAHAGTEGASFWRTVEAGYEEWLLMRAGSREWEVAGATLRQQGDAVELCDAAGMARMKVTAPLAYAADGAVVKLSLAVEGTRIRLTAVTASEGMLLVDPLWQVTGSMANARNFHTATLLPSGKVLGEWFSCCATPTSLSEWQRDLAA